MLNVAIVEDQVEIADQIRTYIGQYCNRHQIDADCAHFPNSEGILNCYRGKTRPQFDIVLLDINLDMLTPSGQNPSALNGMEIARRIRTVDKRVVLAFITSLAQYAIDGYAVDAMDFILKPVTYDTFAFRFERMIARARERMDVQIQVQTSQGVQLVSIGEIRYLETLNRLLYYHVGNGVTWACRNSLREAEKELTHGHFAKCNQCYLVNLSYVRGVQGDQVNVDGEMLDISRRCKTPFLAALTEYLGGLH